MRAVKGADIPKVNGFYGVGVETGASAELRISYFVNVGLGNTCKLGILLSLCSGGGRVPYHPRSRPSDRSNTTKAT